MRETPHSHAMATGTSFRLQDKEDVSEWQMGCFSRVSLQRVLFPVQLHYQVTMCNSFLGLKCLEFNSRNPRRRYEQDPYQEFTSTAFLHQLTGTCLSKVRGPRHYCFSGLIGAVMSSPSKPHVHFRYLNHAQDKRDDLAY